MGMGLPDSVSELLGLIGERVSPAFIFGLLDMCILANRDVTPYSSVQCIYCILEDQQDDWSAEPLICHSIILVVWQFPHDVICSRTSGCHGQMLIVISPSPLNESFGLRWC